MSPVPYSQSEMEFRSPAISLGRVRRKSVPMLTNQSRPSDSRGASFKANVLGNFLQQRVKTEAPELKRVSVPAAAKLSRMEKLSSPWTVAGFVLMDTSLSPISFNAEAVEILGYPNKPANPKRSDLLLTGICSTLLSRQPLGDKRFVTEFRSGRRRYFCRSFVMDAHANNPAHPCIAVLLERGPSGLVPLSQVSQQFNLTQREGEALTYLLQGLSSKEIASRMNVSTNTVKTFLRLTMIKTGVSSRAAMIGKIIMTQL
jgi:DNA-binding CsgD family transcriptional regulator